MSADYLEHLKKDLDFLDELDIEKLKYEISKELGPISGDALKMLDAAESNMEIEQPRIELAVSNDKFQATIKVVRLGQPIAIRESDIRNALAENGVVWGIDESTIEELLVEKIVGQELVIAKGIKPVEGKKGEIKQLVKISSNKLEDCIDSSGRVDFKRSNQSGIVEAGDVIAEKIPSTPGREGRDVLGNAIKPQPQPEAEFVLTPDVGLNPKNPRQLIALKNGILKKNFSIDEKVFINGDVDYSTGNLDYEKSLIIKGDVKSGFQVFCGEDIEIRGCVEDANIVAEGDVLVKQGFLGNGKGYIKGRNVTIGHIKQQEVFATGDIFIGGEAIHCDLQAIGSIKMIGVRGMAIGGQLVAGKGIELVNAGNARHTKTLLRAGCDGDIMVMEKQIEELNTKILKARKMRRIFEVADSERDLSAALKRMMQKLSTTIDHVTGEIEKMENLRKEKIESLVELEKPYVKVSQTVYPNTTIQIGNLKQLVTTEMRNKTFRVHNNKIFTGA